MVIKKYLKGIALVVLILGMLSVTMAAISITSQDPGSSVSNVTGDPARTFTITVSGDSTVTWLVNGTEDQTNLTPNPTFSYTNSSFGVGFWNVTAVARNSTNGSDIDTRTWLWTVTAPSVPDTAPIVTNQNATNITDSSTDITFSVNQSNSNSRVRYGNDSSLLAGTWSLWSNNTPSPRKIHLSGLSKSKLYYYSVYAYNSSNQSLGTNSSIKSFTTLNPTKPKISNIIPGIPTDKSISISFEVNQSNAKTQIKYGKNTSLSSSTTLGLSRNITLLSLDQGTKYYYSIFAYNSTNQTYFNNSTILNFTTKYPIPKKVGTPSPATPLTTTGNDKVTFNISFDQIVNVTWSSNSSLTMPGPNISVTSASLFASSPGVGSWNITASWINGNGSGSYTWLWNVRPTTYFSGNRIWDGSRKDLFGLTYSWTPQSFSGFYYDAKDDVGTENITITLGTYSSRSIAEGNLVYSTSPQEVRFTHTGWGKYQVIGFMADKYFAGYTINTTSAKTRPTTDFEGKSALANGNLHKVLIDDDTKRTISVGGTLALQDGYVLKATDIDLNARTMLLSLLKDGSEVDVSPLSADETYVYSKTVGGVEALPLIMVRFDNVFSGQELQVAFMKGLFQISEDATRVEIGNKFRNMEVTGVSRTGIEMENSGSIGLSKGSTVDIMGDVKIKVADNNSVVRYALTVEKTGDFEVRSTVYRATDTPPITVWTPYNFGLNLGDTSVGFFYDLDDGVGSEELKLPSPVSGRSIPDNDLEYSTKPQEVKFTHTGFGKYQVIGFMAEKYFAGYTSNTGVSGGTRMITRPTTDFSGISTIANGNLHKVLIDDDTKRTISVGSTLALKDGYVIKATDIDLNARAMLLSLLKDGTEVDISPLSAGETYVYTKDVGGTEDLPLIMVRFENVFSGQELQVAFLKGMFQISENPTTVKVADQFGKMEVTGVSRDSITMRNDGSIGLSKNTNSALMGNIRLKVADNDALRFYFAVDVTAEMIENQLVIDVPPKAMAGDTIKIKVTAGGNPAENASLTLDTEIGMTDMDGILNYVLPKNLKAGTYSITATKTGYEKATRDIDVEKYVDYRLSLEAPSLANQYETITIKVLYNGTAMSGADVVFDNKSIGVSDSNGEVTYTLETSGTHSITASKRTYITVSRDIEVRAPYSEYKALDINITPNPGFAGEEFLVRSNITNAGTKKDTLPVELIINGSAVDNRSVTLGPGENAEVNFTWTEDKASNVTVAILGQSMLYQVKENPTNYLLIGAIITGIGAVIIYILTSKGILSMELLKQKYELLIQKFNLLFKK